MARISYFNFIAQRALLAFHSTSLLHSVTRFCAADSSVCLADSTTLFQRRSCPTGDSHCLESFYREVVFLFHTLDGTVRILLFLLLLSSFPLFTLLLPLAVHPLPSQESTTNSGGLNPHCLPCGRLQGTDGSDTPRRLGLIYTICLAVEGMHHQWTNTQTGSIVLFLH